MTFEQIFKTKIKALIEGKTGRKTTVTNDIFYNPLGGNADGISVLLKSGNATKSAVPNFDFNTMSLMATVLVQSNYLQEILGVLNSVADDNNATFTTVDVGDITYNCKLVFSTPYAVGSPFDMHVDRNTIKCSQILWLINITYSHNALIEPTEFKLTVGDTQYDINYIYQYDGSSTPANEMTQYKGQSRMNYDQMAKCSVFSFILYRVASDEFQAVLDEEINGDDGLFGQTLSLKIGANTAVAISNYTVSKTYVNNSEAITLSLMR